MPRQVKLKKMLISSMFAMARICAVVTAFTHSNKRSATQVLMADIFSGVFREHQIFLVHDSESLNDLFLDQTVFGESTFMLSSQENLENVEYPAHYLRDEIGVVILLIKSSPMEFLNYLASSPKWAPTRLVLVVTGSSINTGNILRHEVVQRSLFVVLFVLSHKNEKEVFHLYTSNPFSAKSSRVPLGIWNKKKFLTMDALFLDRFRDFDGQNLLLASWCDDYPFIYLNPEGEGCKGSNLDALEVMGEKLNFTFTVQKETQDQNWGALENGTWTGMLGDLVYNGKHIVINYFLTNYERWRDFDFTYPYHAEGFGFLVRKPPPLPKWRSLTYPFNTKMWGAIFAVTMAISVIVALLLPRMDVWKKGVRDYVKYGVLVCAGMVRQSVALTPNRGWERLCLVWWWLGCIIISTAFMGNLIAFLTVPIYPLRIETVQQLARSDLRVAMQDYGEFVPEELKRSSDESLNTIGHKLDLWEYHLEYQPGIKGVMERTHALIESYSYLINVQIRYNVTKDTYMMKDQVYPGHVSWFLPKNTAYTPKISSLLTRLKETGLLQKLFKDHFESTSSSSFGQGAGSQPLNIGQLQGAFLLLAFGGMISFIILLLEVSFGAWNK